MSSRHQLEHLVRSDRIWRCELIAINAELLAGTHLVADVDLRRRIVADKHRRQSWPDSLRDQFLHLGGYFLFDLGGDLVAVENGCQYVRSLHVHVKDKFK